MSSITSRKQRGPTVFTGITVLFIIVLTIFIINQLMTNEFIYQSYHLITGKLSSKVLGEQALVEKYAAEYEISEYVPVLMAIMEVESGGEGEDIMQSSESLGLLPNTLSKEESVEQGVAYFKRLLEIGREYNSDINTIVQAYNFGPAFIEYIAENGGVYSFSLAQEYAKEKSEGRMTHYMNYVSYKENGGWRYDYGNMFYASMVDLFVPE